MEAPTAVPSRKMTACDHTPSNGESVTDASQLERLGRALLCSNLEIAADDLRAVFIEASGEVKDGADVEDLDIAEMDHAVEQARALVDEIRQVRESEKE